MPKHARRVVVTLEIETNVPLKTLRDKTRLALAIRSNCRRYWNEHLLPEQAQVNVIGLIEYSDGKVSTRK